MTIAYATTQDGRRVELQAGTTVGHMLVRHHGLVVDGLDVRRSTLRADGEFGTLFQAPFPPMTGNGQPVDELTIRRCTLDGAALASLSSIVGGTAAAGPRRIVLEDVAIQDNHRDTIALLNSGEVIASRVSIVGNGTSILSTLDSSLTRLRQIQVTGGRAGFVVADGPTGTVEGIDIADMEVDLGYQAATRWEAASRRRRGARPGAPSTLRRPAGAHPRCGGRRREAAWRAGAALGSPRAGRRHVVPGTRGDRGRPRPPRSLAPPRIVVRRA
jgi:hypothetical protein